MGQNEGEGPSDGKKEGAHFTFWRVWHFERAFQPPGESGRELPQAAPVAQFSSQLCLRILVRFFSAAHITYMKENGSG